MLVQLLIFFVTIKYLFANSSHFVSDVLHFPISIFVPLLPVMHAQVISTRDSSSLYVPMILTNLSNATLWVSYGVLGVHDVSTTVRVLSVLKFSSMFVQ